MSLQAMIEDDALIALTAHHWCWGADNSGDVRRPENIRFIWEEAKVSLDRCIEALRSSRLVHNPAANLCALKWPCNCLCDLLATLPIMQQSCKSSSHPPAKHVVDAHSSSHARSHLTRQQNMLIPVKQPHIPSSSPPAKALLACRQLPCQTTACSFKPWSIRPLTVAASLLQRKCADMGTPGVMLVTGDGSIDCQEDPNEQER